jgi:hypothetical protein
MEGQVIVIMELFNAYTIYARTIPSAITSLPLILFHHFYVNPEFLSFTSFVLGLQIISTVSAAVVLVILLIEINRAISKLIFENIYFKSGLGMPTTDLLLYSNTRLSASMKAAIREKVRADFNITLLTKQQEQKNLAEARRRISEAMMLIRGKVPEGERLAQYNRQYGFMRNLIGGSVLALAISIFNVYFFTNVFKSELAYTISVILIIIYILPIVLSYVIMKHYGRHYAECLIRDYLLHEGQ